MKIYPIVLALAAPLPPSLFAQNKTYIMVHGGWHGAWSWNKIVPLIEAQGNNAIAVDLPGHGEDKNIISEVTLDDCVQDVVAVAKDQKGPVILVGHSMGGVIIAQAAEKLGKDKVSKLVFLDAFMPRNGESVFSMVEKEEEKATPLNRKKDPGMGESMIFSEDQKACALKYENVETLFYHDCHEQDITFAKSRLGWESVAVLATPVKLTDQIYGVIPKVYILCTEAKDMDKSMIAKNVLCEKIYKLASSHSPFFSMPEQLVKILHEL